MRERGPRFYDEWYRGRREWPAKSHRPIYKWIAARVVEPVLDLGCGDGSLASILWGHGIHIYSGVDFSKVAIGTAQSRVQHPCYLFSVDDIRTMPIHDEVLDGSVVLCEVLEHVADDLGLLRRIPVGAMVVGSVPLFRGKSWTGGGSHLRRFRSEKSILDRYGGLARFAELEKVRKWWCFVARRI